MKTARYASREYIILEEKPIESFSDRMQAMMKRGGFSSRVTVRLAKGKKQYCAFLTRFGTLRRVCDCPAHMYIAETP